MTAGSHEQLLRQALAGRAATIEPRPDPDRLRAAMVRTDRLRVVRTTGAAALLCTVAVLGVFAVRTGDSASPADVADLPGLDQGPPDAGFPLIDDPADENAEDAAPDTTVTVTTTTAGAAITTGEPAHLDPTPSTTAAPAPLDTTTTVPAPTTAPPPPTTTTAAAAPIPFSAEARYGSCEEDPPYDEYSGTAAPGATVTVTSPWNATATTTADGSGQWFLRVEFPDAPVGEVFQVTTTDGSSRTVFDFVRTA